MCPHSQIKGPAFHGCGCAKFLFLGIGIVISNGFTNSSERWSLKVIQLHDSLENFVELRTGLHEAKIGQQKFILLFFSSQCYGLIEGGLPFLPNVSMRLNLSAMEKTNLINSLFSSRSIWN
jgi:hypothetical protein